MFQNPDSALNRRHSVQRLISRSLSRLGGYHGEALMARLKKLIAEVRLSERHLSMRPAQLSGGLKQRVAIARAFAGDPRIVVCDEPTSALDVSVQAAILNLLTDLQHREDVSYLFISHDLGVVRYLADRIAVLYLGRIMEIGPADQVFNPPHHPYTEALLSAVPTLEDSDGERIRLEGEIPSPADPPTGCVFHTRCPRFLGDICVNTEPPLAETEPGHAIRCHIPLEELRRLQDRRLRPEDVGCRRRNDDRVAKAADRGPTIMPTDAQVTDGPIRPPGLGSSSASHAAPVVHRTPYATPNSSRPTSSYSDAPLRQHDTHNTTPAAVCIAAPSRSRRSPRHRDRERRQPRKRQQQRGLRRRQVVDPDRRGSSGTITACATPETRNSAYSSQSSCRFDSSDRDGALGCCGADDGT